METLENTARKEERVQPHWELHILGNELNLYRNISFDNDCKFPCFHYPELFWIFESDAIAAPESPCCFAGGRKSGEEHSDTTWIRDVPPLPAENYLLLSNPVNPASFRGPLLLVDPSIHSCEDGRCRGYIKIWRALETLISKTTPEKGKTAFEHEERGLKV